MDKSMIRETLENIGADVRVALESDWALMRGYEVAGDADVIAKVHAKNARLKAECKERLMKRYE